ncbi:transthyretin-like family domain-containing protein [Ditylenchus destructor]|uniref:Transthyretin-like family domain-containing protein n=1 Tax=Ditylenchus destructor TaxID=166010 RepID=A0AAD4N265_9BILA|nr:transthyretin-like family domain-containing protein [Ditylenchus destructor]
MQSTYFIAVIAQFCVLVPLSVFGFRMQSAGVRGVLMCGDEPLANTKVKLWDNDRGLDLDDLLEEGTTDAKGRFQLIGKHPGFINPQP